MRVIHNGVKSGKLDTCHCRHGTSKNSIWKTRLYFLTTCFKENQRLIICNIWTQLRKMHCAQLLSHVQLFPNPWTVDTRLLCPWDFSGKNTRVDCHFLLQGIFPTQESNLGLLHRRRFFTVWAAREAQEYWSEQPIPSPGDLADPGIKPGSPELQADSLLEELPGKPKKDEVQLK